MKVDFGDKKIYYLCADTHYYQKSVINIGGQEIEQIITGTGGANKDDLPTIEGRTDTRIIDSINVTYTYGVQHKTNGFLIVSTDGGMITTKFCDAISLSEYEHKYLKYKKKYLQIKNTFLL